MLTEISEMPEMPEMALMVEAVRTSETSVNIYLTARRYIPADSKLHTRRRENLKFCLYKNVYYTINVLS
jgi:hypothetical protein